MLVSEAGRTDSAEGVVDCAPAARKSENNTANRETAGTDRRRRVRGARAVRVADADGALASGGEVSIRSLRDKAFQTATPERVPLFGIVAKRWGKMQVPAGDAKVLCAGSSQGCHWKKSQPNCLSLGLASGQA